MWHIDSTRISTLDEYCLFDLEAAFDVNSCKTTNGIGVRSFGTYHFRESNFLLVASSNQTCVGCALHGHFKLFEMYGYVFKSKSGDKASKSHLNIMLWRIDFCECLTTVVQPTKWCRKKKNQTISLKQMDDRRREKNGK